MWPSVTSNRVFGAIPCPSAATCDLPNCMFSHEAETAPAIIYSPTRSFTATNVEPELEPEPLELDSDVEARTEAASIVEQEDPVFVGQILSQDKAPAEKAAQHNKPNKDVSVELLRSAVRPISPPPTAAASKTEKKTDPVVALMPRKLSREPATFTKRVTLLKALHSYMKPINDKMARATRPDVKALQLTPNQLNKLAVDEEERIATEHPSVYENILKQRLVKLKSMPPEVWFRERKEAEAREKGLPPKKPQPKRVETGLTAKQEIAVLSTLKCSQDGLDAFGYVTKQPTQEQLTEARLTLKSADHWEECSRCTSRFQVFPDRREEDGALTSGGKCQYHWGKRVFPERSRKSKNAAVPDPTRLSCCDEVVGTPGCTTADTHVFTVKDHSRLSLIMPFIQTPENSEVSPDTAVCFDCEMGYTTNGLELLRLTVVSWPIHKPIIDVLVRPLGHVLDVNTRFSGVTAEQFVNAKPYDPENPKPMRHNLRIVDSPYAARDLFLSRVSPETPVLGHALENDLNTIRLIHPFIIDTVLLFPHRQGLPYRHGLRMLVKKHLGEEIQQGGAAGHDSFEDAKTTGELVRFKVKEKWISLKSDGWTARDDGVYPPVPKGIPPPPPSMAPTAPMAVLQGKPAEKRKLSDHDSQDEDGPLTKK